MLPSCEAFHFSRKSLQIRPHHIRDATDLGSLPKLIRACLAFLKTILECLQCNVETDLVPAFETIGYGLGDMEYRQCNTFNAVSLDPILKPAWGETNDA